MEIYFQILVAILSTVLLIFLILAIMVLVAIRKLIRKVDAVTDKAGDLVETVTNVGQTFSKFGGPLVLARFFADKFRGKKNKRR